MDFSAASQASFALILLCLTGCGSSDSADTHESGAAASGGGGFGGIDAGGNGGISAVGGSAGAAAGGSAGSGGNTAAGGTSGSGGNPGGGGNAGNGGTGGATGDLYPNRPAGLTPLFVFDGNGVPHLCPKDGFAMTLGVACGQNESGGKAAVVTSGDAPADGPSVLDILYPTGLKGGNSPFAMWMWSDTSMQQMVEYYEAGWLRIGNGSNATTFEGPGTGEWKVLGYWAVNNTPGGYSAQIYGVASGQSGVGNSWSLSIRAQGATSWTTGGGTLLGGKWYRYEIHMVLNDIGASNGVLEVWLTNVSDSGSANKVTSKTDRLFRTASAPAGFWQRSYDPVWGGGGGVKTRDDHVQISRMAGFGRHL